METVELTTEATTQAENVLDEVLHDSSKLGQFFDSIWEVFLAYLPTLILAVVLLILGWFAIKLILKLMRKGASRGKVEKTVISFVYSFVKVTLYIILVSSVLAVLGVPAASIIAVIGTAGVAIGLALQGSLSNIASGFIILFEKPFKTGDYIEISGTSGYVEHISIFYTRIKTLNSEAVFIPNSSVCNAVVQNNYAYSERRISIPFSISYHDSYEKARDVILSVAARNDKILKKPAPSVCMTAHGASAIEVTAYIYVKPKDYYAVLTWMQETVRNEFIANDIEIPFNQLDVHITKE